jgi:Dyp-type peroxidase family
METLDLHDIQGLVARGYGRLHGCTALLLRFDDPQAGQQWLGALTPRVTSALRHPADTAVNVAFTFPGLVALGLDRRDIRGFSPPFVEGMVSPTRSRLLGDVEDSAPACWAWGAPGVGSGAVHAVLLLYALDDDRLGRLVDKHRHDLEAARVTVAHALDTHVNPDRFGFKEHFGFRDGIGQPAIAGLHHVGADGIAPGEFVLGYPNEYHKYPSTPVVRSDPTGWLPRLEAGHGFDLGRNGTYLILRQLRQDVQRFWNTLRERTESEDQMVWLAAKMIGRWPSGAPIVESPDRDLPGMETLDTFGYRGDPHGYACPLGAHARRANPRDALPTSSNATQSLTITRRHRLIRRGRPYGPPLAPSLDPRDLLTARDDGTERGLQFLCLNANIERQFEFVQHTWLNNPKFSGLYGTPDPLFGDRRHERTDSFHAFFVEGMPARRRWTHLTPFITVRGGAYFFMPGLQTLRYLAAVSPP